MSTLVVGSGILEKRDPTGVLIAIDRLACLSCGRCLPGLAVRIATGLCERCEKEATR